MTLWLDWDIVHHLNALITYRKVRNNTLAAELISRQFKQIPAYFFSRCNQTLSCKSFVGSDLFAYKIWVLKVMLVNTQTSAAVCSTLLCKPSKYLVGHCVQISQQGYWHPRCTHIYHFFKKYNYTVRGDLLAKIFSVLKKHGKIFVHMIKGENFTEYIV